jgi:chromosome transmission fidelity protein 18
MLTLLMQWAHSIALQIQSRLHAYMHSFLPTPSQHAKVAMSSSPPSLPSSDPDFDALFPGDPAPILPASTTNSDDLEALHVQEHELADAKKRNGTVIQHRSWQLEDVLKSDEIFPSETPSRQEPVVQELQSSPPTSVEKPRAKMPFSSSPVLFPQSSSPPVLTKKRKLFQTLGPAKSKKPRTDESYPELAEKEPENPTPLELPATTNRHEDLESSPPRARSPELPVLPTSFLQRPPSKTTPLVTSCGKQVHIPLRRKTEAISYEQLVAQRSVVAEGRAKKAYYGVDIHDLLSEAAKEKVLKAAQLEIERERQPVESIERPMSSNCHKSNAHQMWTEKYRARKFTDLVGDERTHRSVLKWLKAWDNIVFPGSVKAKPKKAFQDRDGSFERQNRKILLLTGPPGLGKTTLAHVCARQAGYEVLEINASDDRSRDVVKGRIKDALGTENVRGIREQGQDRKAGRPMCVVVDEVDGVVTGSGAGGEGGFTKALIDLVLLDQKNAAQPTGQQSKFKNKKAGDKFRLLRPLILICNDVYAPSLRPLRNSSFAEIVHVRKAPLERVIARLKDVFEKEHIPADGDALRRLCEHSWGLGSRKQNSIGSRGSGEGDIRGILVQGEWVAHKLRAASGVLPKLTRKWVDAHLSTSNSSSDGKGLARGGVREVVERIFIEGAGLPNLPAANLTKEEQRQLRTSKDTPTGVAESRKRTTIIALREMVDTCGEYDRLMTDCFATYPIQAYQDDWNMSKANAGYEWLHFHDSLSSRIFSGQEWELNPYLSTSACGFHHLFSVLDKGASGWEKKDAEKEEEEEHLHPFSGVRADFAAFEAQKQNSAVLTEFQASFSAPLLRLFNSTEAIATELIPNVSRMLAPDVKPVVVGGSSGSATVASVRKESERSCVQRGVRVMSALNVSFEKARVEAEGGGAHSNAGFVYRMEP